MSSESRLRPHFETAQRGLANLNLESWYQLTDILDSAGRIGTHPHALFAAKVIFQCRSILIDIDEVKWEEIRWKSEAAQLSASLSELLAYIEGDNFPKICATLNSIVRESYRIKFVATSMPQKNAYEGPLSS